MLKRILSSIFDNGNAARSLEILQGSMLEKKIINTDEQEDFHKTYNQAVKDGYIISDGRMGRIKLSQEGIGMLKKLK